MRISTHDTRALDRQLDLALIAILLFLGVMLGGSSQIGVDKHLWMNGLACIAIIAAFVRHRPSPITGETRLIAICFAAIVVMAIVQLIPLPAALQGNRFAHSVIGETWPLLELNPSDRPISLAPSQSIQALLGYAPPMAALLVVATGRWNSTARPLAWLLVIVGALGAVLAIAQVASGFHPSLFLYGVQPFPVGLFGNQNHQASMLVMVMPLSIALIVERKRALATGDGKLALLISACALLFLLVSGIVILGSYAGYALLLSVLPLCFFVLFPRRVPGRKAGLAGLILPVMLVLSVGLLIVSVLYVTAVPETVWVDGRVSTGRIEIWDTSLSVLWDHFPWGVGLGAFEFVYPLYEDPDALGALYVNAAHNDYLQVMAALGLVGVVLIMTGLFIWGRLVHMNWTRSVDEETRLRMAASISTFVVLLHSLADYPVRAPLYAIAASVCVGIMAIPLQHQRYRQAPSEVGPEPSSRITI